MNWMRPLLYAWLLLLAATPAMADEGHPTHTEVQRVHVGPGDHFQRLYPAFRPDSFQRLERRKGWDKVRFTFHQSRIQAWAQVPGTASEQVSAAPPATELEGRSTPMGRATTRGRLNLRAGPGTGYPILTDLPAGYELALLDEGEDAWRRVRAEIGEAWLEAWVHHGRLKPLQAAAAPPEPSAKAAVDAAPEPQGALETGDATPGEDTRPPAPASGGDAPQAVATPPTAHEAKPDPVMPPGPPAAPPAEDGTGLPALPGGQATIEVTLAELLGPSVVAPRASPQPPSPGTPAARGKAGKGSGGDPFHVVMVPWRGITDGERGFMDYLRRRNVPVRYTFLDCDKDPSRLPGFVEEIKRLRPDLIYVFGTTGALGLAGPDAEHPAGRYITDIPIVFNIVSVPVQSGLVKTLASSGRNLTGASHVVPLPIQVKAIQSLRPIHRLGVLFNPKEQNAVLAAKELAAIGAKEGIEVIDGPFDVDEAGNPRVETIPEVVERLGQADPQFIYFPSDSFLVANAAKVVEVMNRLGIPSFSATEVPINEAGPSPDWSAATTTSASWPATRRSRSWWRRSPPRRSRWRP
jgi:putative tryptophan/tyrosine transport system substrate-binding protein